MLSGDNGLLKRAGDARDDTVVGQEKEQVELAYVSAAVKKLGDNVDKDDLQDELDISVGENKTTVTGGGTLKVKFKDTENEYTVSQNGKVAKFETVEATDIYVAVCTNGALVFSNNEASINTYISENNTSLYSGWTNIENITNAEYYYHYDEETDTVTCKIPKWCGCNPDDDWNTTSYATDITTAIILTQIVPSSTNCCSWFYGLSGLRTINNIDNLNTINVTDMGQMFSSCSSLTSLDLSSFSTSNVTDMGSMFYGCGNLSSLNVSNFDTSNVTDMSYMFTRCEKLTSLNVSGFDTSNVTNMDDMFAECRLLTSLNVSNFNTTKVTNMYNMFVSCEKLTILDLTSFDTSNVTDMGQMFSSCSSLTSLDLSSFSTSNVRFMSTMFKNCTNLVTIYASSNFVTTSVNGQASDMFSNCTSLVGGNGTAYNSSRTNKIYAQIDTASTPGYFTLKTN